MAFNYQAYTKADVKNVHPGYDDAIYVAPRSAFLVLQEPVLPGAAPGDTVRITTAHTFGPTEGFIKIILQPDSAQANATLVGPKGAKRLKHAPQFSIQGDSAKLLEMIINLVNEDLILIYKDANCPGGQLIQYGCSCKPVQISEGEFTSSNTGEDDGQKAYVLTADASCKYFYDSTITEKPAA